MKEKEWAKTTVLNFLARLVEKGFLKRESQGKNNIYSPLICEAEYFRYKNNTLLKRFYGNSIKNMVAELYRDEILELYREALRSALTE
jgi:predicted transcriptional regulator